MRFLVGPAVMVVGSAASLAAAGAIAYGGWELGALVGEQFPTHTTTAHQEARFIGGVASEVLAFGGLAAAVGFFGVGGSIALGGTIMMEDL